MPYVKHSTPESFVCMSLSGSATAHVSLPAGLHQIAEHRAQLVWTRWCEATQRLSHRRRLRYAWIFVTCAAACLLQLWVCCCCTVAPTAAACPDLSAALHVLQKKLESMKKAGSQLEARQKALPVTCPVCKVGVLAVAADAQHMQQQLCSCPAHPCY